MRPLVLLVRALALGLLVGAPALLGARRARRRGVDLDGVARDLAAARSLGQALELVGRLVDRLEVALVLELLARRRDVGVPDLRHPAARQLDLALVERRLDLQQQQRLFDVEHVRHEPTRVSTVMPIGNTHEHAKRGG